MSSVAHNSSTRGSSLQLARRCPVCIPIHANAFRRALQGLTPDQRRLAFALLPKPLNPRRQQDFGG
eukprot:3812538-Pyramimonas_sp.AAC.1